MFPFMDPCNSVAPGGSVRGSGQPSEAVERKPHLLQAGASSHSRVGSVQRHSDSKSLLIGQLVFCYFRSFCVHISICDLIALSRHSLTSNRYSQGSYGHGKVLEFLKWLFPVLEKTLKKIKSQKLCKGHANVFY